MENIVDKNVEALERASRELDKFAFDFEPLKDSNRILWHIFEDSFTRREEGDPVTDIAQRFFLYDSLRNIIGELEKIEWKANHAFKISYEPKSPSES